MPFKNVYHFEASREIAKEDHVPHIWKAANVLAQLGMSAAGHNFERGQFMAFVAKPARKGFANRDASDRKSVV